MSKNQRSNYVGRGKHSNHPNTVVHTSIQFDKFFVQTNRPTAAKSAGTVGKWGVTSFTSIRSAAFIPPTANKDTSRFSSLNKKKAANQNEPKATPEAALKLETCPVVQPRKFFKSRSLVTPAVADAKVANSAKAVAAVKVAKQTARAAKEATKVAKEREKLLKKRKKVDVSFESPKKVFKEEVPTRKSERNLRSRENNKNEKEVKYYEGDDDEEEEEEEYCQVVPAKIVRKQMEPAVEENDEEPEQEEEEEEEEDEVKNEDEEEEAPPVEGKDEKVSGDEKDKPPPIVLRIFKGKARLVSESSKSSPDASPEHSEKVTEENLEKVELPPPPPPATALPVRNTRRRVAVEPMQVSPPKRALRSTRNNTVQVEEPVPPEKLVITNLHGKPSVKTAETNLPAQKHHKQKHKTRHHHKHYNNNNNEEEKNQAGHGDVEEMDVVEEKVDALDKRVEEMLGQVGGEEALIKVEETPAIGNDEELLELLQDEDEKGPEKEVEKPPSFQAEKTEDLKTSLEEMSTAFVEDDPSKALPESVGEFPKEILNDKKEEVKAEEVAEKVEEKEAPPRVKKGSIFKCRGRGEGDGNKKRLALYKHKWTDANGPPQKGEMGKTCSDSKNAACAYDEDDFDDSPLTRVAVQVKGSAFSNEQNHVTSVKVGRKDKEFYTVVKNVKKAHQIQESGEFQEFNDDVEYILDALQDNNPIGTRCLSAITLATKCMEPAFRMHVRAHSTVTKFFRTLHDATKDQSLAMCTATVMFVLCQDRLNIDLDRDSLELMLNLLESDASHTSALQHCGLTDSQLVKTRDKVRQICTDIQAQGHAKHLNLQNITIGNLAMETLLSLTSKRAGEWFKEEVRELGGLEHIVKTVVECCRHVDDTVNAWTPASLDKIRKLNRCLRVLENVTMQNEQNNSYLLSYESGVLIDTLIRMYKVCDYEIPLYPTNNTAGGKTSGGDSSNASASNVAAVATDDKDSAGAVLTECLMANLKVLINITHDYQDQISGSKMVGGRSGVVESSLHILLQVPQYIPKEERFDLIILTLILLINLVENCEENRQFIVQAQAPSDDESIFETKCKEPAVKALINLFNYHEEMAKTEEKRTDAILEGDNPVEKPAQNAPQKAHEEFFEETITQLLQKAGQNMEHTMIAAYVAMLVAYLIIDKEENEKFVRNLLPDDFSAMIDVLQKFYTFMTLTISGGTVSNKAMKATQMVIRKLIESDNRSKRLGIEQAETSSSSSLDDSFNKTTEKSIYNPDSD